MDFIKRKVLPVLILLCFLFNTTIAQQNLPEIGDEAPNLSISKILSPENKEVPELKNLKGQVVLIEFWATWCGPCIPAMDHLNKLKSSFPDNKLSIIAISDENEEPVQRFLKNKPVDFMVVLDQNHSSFDTYYPRTMPHTVVINPKGKIAAITKPENIQKKHINKLLEGNKINLPVKDYGKVLSQQDELFRQNMEKKNSQTLYKTVLRKTDNMQARTKLYYPKDSLGVNYHKRRMTALGVPPITLFMVAYDFPYNKTVNQYGLSMKEPYYMDIILPRPNEDKLYKTAQSLLQEAFQADASVQKKQMEAYVLKQIEGQPLKLEKSTSGEELYTMKGPSMKAKHKPIDQLVNYLTNFTGPTPVVDGTDLNGRYNYSLNWSMSNRKSLFKSLNKLGLELVKEETIVEVLVIKKQ